MMSVILKDISVHKFLYGLCLFIDILLHTKFKPLYVCLLSLFYIFNAYAFRKNFSVIFLDCY
jgi:hypothetical protein